MTVATFKTFLILVTGLAALGLGLAVLIGKPDNSTDLLSGGIIAAGAGFIFSVWPSK
jgi:hypothetical protein